MNIFEIPAMSSEPERIFSLAGLMVTSKRNKLHLQIIEAAQCVKSWDQGGIYDIRSMSTVTETLES